MIRCPCRIFRQSFASFHWLGSDDPDTYPTETGMTDLMTSYCCSTRATVGAINHETYPRPDEVRNARFVGYTRRQTNLAGLALSLMLHSKHRDVCLSRTGVKGNDDVAMQALFEKLVLVPSGVYDAGRGCFEVRVVAILDNRHGREVGMTDAKGWRLVCGVCWMDRVGIETASVAPTKRTFDLGQIQTKFATEPVFPVKGVDGNRVLDAWNFLAPQSS